MEMKKLMEDISAIMEGKLSGYYYHGTQNPISQFSDEFVGRGNDEYGPGIYFTSNPITARGYCEKSPTGMVYECELTIRKELSKSQKINKSVLLKLIQNTPDDEAYTNWDENQNRAIRTALDSYMNEDSMYDALMSVWYDWYNNHPTQFVRALTHLGYDAYTYKFDNGEVFVILYNVASIKVVNSYTLEEAISKFGN